MRAALDKAGLSATFIAERLQYHINNGSLKALDMLIKLRGYYDPLPTRTALQRPGDPRAREREKRDRITSLIGITAYPIPVTEAEAPHVGGAAEDTGGAGNRDGGTGVRGEGPIIPGGVEELQGEEGGDQGTELEAVGSEGDVEGTVEGEEEGVGVTGQSDGQGDGEGDDTLGGIDPLPSPYSYIPSAPAGNGNGDGDWFSPEGDGGRGGE